MSNSKPRTPWEWEIRYTLGPALLMPRLPVGDKLIAELALFGEYMEPRGASASTGDWHVRYLRYALRGRAKEVVAYAKSLDPDEAKLALKGIQKVYDFRWPHQASTRYIFHWLLGWLQLELERPGESKPMTPSEQREAIRKHLEARGDKIKEWQTDGFGGVFAITDEEDDDDDDWNDEDSEEVTL